MTTELDAPIMPKTAERIAVDVLLGFLENHGESHVRSFCEAAGASEQEISTLLNELKIRAASAKFDVELAETLGFTNDLMAADLLPPTSRT